MIDRKVSINFNILFVNFIDYIVNGWKISLSILAIEFN
jgi:hypothetical protein